MGIKVTAVEVRDVILPDSRKGAMAGRVGAGEFLSGLKLGFGVYDF